MFIVPMDTPGIKVVPMHLLGDHNINYTFYEDVRVPGRQPGRAGRTTGGP